MIPIEIVYIYVHLILFVLKRKACIPFCPSKKSVKRTACLDFGAFEMDQFGMNVKSAADCRLQALCPSRPAQSMPLGKSSKKASIVLLPLAISGAPLCSRRCFKCGLVSGRAQAHVS